MYLAFQERRGNASLPHESFLNSAVFSACLFWLCLGAVSIRVCFSGDMGSSREKNTKRATSLLMDMHQSRLDDGRDRA